MRMLTLLLALIATIIVPITALADRPQCTIDPDTGMFDPNSGTGVCFGEGTGFGMTIVDDEGEFAGAFDNPDSNQFLRLKRNGKPFFHVVGKELFVVYCSAATVAADNCNPFSGEAFEGIGKVKINTAVEGFAFICPLTARVDGVAEDSFGNVVEFVGALTLVPDATTVCRASLARVDAMPVVD